VWIRGAPNKKSRILLYDSAAHLELFTREPKHTDVNYTIDGSAVLTIQDIAKSFHAFIKHHVNDTNDTGTIHLKCDWKSVLLDTTGVEQSEVECAIFVFSRIMDQLLGDQVKHRPKRKELLQVFKRIHAANKPFDPVALWTTESKEPELYFPHNDARADSTLPP